jgi:energy-coupling factor transporter ATP-binding protein EcfA2
VAELVRLQRTGTAIAVCEHRHDAFAHIDDLRRHPLPGTVAADMALPALEPRVPAFRLVVEGLAVALGGQPVLDGIDVTFAGGQVISVVGANGAGKTTLLRALTGLQPHDGRISGFASSARPPRLGMCFQNPDRQLFNPTVRDELRYGRPTCDEQEYRRVLELLGLSRYEHTAPLLLSEGEKKRLGLGILLLTPGLSGVCLDEPTLGQDTQHRRLLGSIMRRLADAGYLCLVATHDLAWAVEWSDQTYVLRDGRLVSGDATAIAGPARPHRAEAEYRTGARKDDACRGDACAR